MRNKQLSIQLTTAVSSGNNDDNRITHHTDTVLHMNGVTTIKADRVKAQHFWFSRNSVCFFVVGHKWGKNWVVSMCRDGIVAGFNICSSFKHLPLLWQSLSVNTEEGWNDRASAGMFVTPLPHNKKIKFHQRRIAADPQLNRHGKKIKLKLQKSLQTGPTLITQMAFRLLIFVRHMYFKKGLNVHYLRSTDSKYL